MTNATQDTSPAQRPADQKTCACGPDCRCGPACVCTPQARCTPACACAN